MTKLSDHFSLEELTYSDLAVRHGIDNNPNGDFVVNLTRLAKLLERVRLLLNKPIHINRTLDSMDENDLPKTIAQIFDESITDFKKLTPLKESKTGDFIIQGASNLSTFNLDEFVYDDEKPENGGVFGKDDKYKGNLNIYPYDDMISLNNALFYSGDYFK